MIVIDAAAVGARRAYEDAVALGGDVVVHGDAPWAAPGDVVDPFSACLLALYAQRVVGVGLPAILANQVQARPA